MTNNFSGFYLSACIVCASVFSIISPFHEHANAAEKLDSPQQMETLFKKAKQADENALFLQADNYYKTMLGLNPNLPRVKLERAVVNMKLGRNALAEELFQEVLAANPPPAVRANITSVQAINNKKLKTHMMSGSVAAGINYDSNANSATTTGNITFLDTNVAANSENDDIQYYWSATSQYTYNMPRSLVSNAYNGEFQWLLSATYYETDQNELDSQNIQLIGFKTGPQFDFYDINTTLGLFASYNMIELDKEDYLTTTTLEGTAKHQFTDRFSMNSTLSYEYREFEDSSTVSTYSEKSGAAGQAKLGAQYKFTPSTWMDASVTFRKENTEREYTDYDSLGGNLSLTHLITPKLFVQASGGYSEKDYDGADTLISATTIREDADYIGSLTIGYEFHDNMVITGGYTKRKVDSNLQNYEYENDRFSVAVSYKF